ncbi:hypothetical protein [Achromobacter xylosoxidans]|uniref:hypothetical protein n=1 Tax=Alcaligenes xylosoxydans xylosoxydans TaxID=85698 RepID=UPI00192BF4AF|nr:hypothetical protein [Achromobacter xylosoxidans]
MKLAFEPEKVQNLKQALHYEQAELLNRRKSAYHFTIRQAVREMIRRRITARLAELLAASAKRA